MDLAARFSNTRHDKQVIVRAITCSLLLVLPGCGIPVLRQALPGPTLSANYAAGYKGADSLDNSALVPIEDFFKDSKLTSLICQALSGNQDLRIMYEDVQIARNEILGRSGAYLPGVGIGFSAGVEKFSKFTPQGAAEEQLQYLPGKNFPGLPGNFLLAANISWQVDIWRQLRNSRDAAVYRFLASKEGRNYAITRLVAEIADNYFMLIALDKRLENLDNIIKLQELSLRTAEFKMKFPRAGGARDTALAVQRFLAEVRKNQSQKLITKQEIIEVENRINFLVGRYPQPVERNTGSLSDFINLNLHALSVGVPTQLLQYRPDIRQAERELVAAGLDVKVARARFFPQLNLTGPLGPAGPYSPVGVQAFSPQYLFYSPQSILASFAADLVTPLINKRSLKADYKNANARQLQAVYDYQRVILKAFTEVVNSVSKVQNYTQSIEIKKQQVQALEQTVDIASKMFQSPVNIGGGFDSLNVLFAQRDLWDARLLLIETKEQQLSAVVNVYQALGGGLLGCGCGGPRPPQTGPNLEPPQQGGSNSSGMEELPAPRKQPDQSPDPNLQKPSQLPEPSKPTTNLPLPAPDAASSSE